MVSARFQQYGLVSAERCSETAESRTKGNFNPLYSLQAKGKMTPSGIAGKKVSQFNERLIYRHQAGSAGKFDGSFQGLRVGPVAFSAACRNTEVGKSSQSLPCLLHFQI